MIFGLGNPGKKYELTRHNVGSRVIDELKSLDLKNVILAKPQSFMNESGKVIKKLIGNYKPSTGAKLGAGLVPHRPDKIGTGAGSDIGNLIIVHDDIDLPIGKIRIVKNRGAAGHKGVESIIKELGTKNFIRFRIGISPEKPSTRAKLGAGPVPHRPDGIGTGAGFVLQKFTKEEEKIIYEVIKKTTEAIEIFLEKGLEIAMNKFNK